MAEAEINSMKQTLPTEEKKKVYMILEIFLDLQGLRM